MIGTPGPSFVRLGERLLVFIPLGLVFAQSWQLFILALRQRLRHDLGTPMGRRGLTFSGAFGEQGRQQIDAASTPGN